MKLLSLDPLAGWSGDGSVLQGGTLVLVLSRLHTLRVFCTELWGCRVWEIRYSVILLYRLPCKVTSSSGHMKQLPRGSQGRGCRFSGWEVVSSGR